MQEPTQEPRNLIRLWFCIAAGLALWFSPTPEGLNEPAWHIFAVFAATILSLLLRPLPMGLCVLIGLLSLVMGLAIAPTYTTYNGFTEAEVTTTTEGFYLYYVFVEGVAEKDLGKAALQQALSGFADKTTWLVVAAFLIAGAIVRSGLGRRLALMLISKLGGTTLGLGYAISAAELALGPFVPSNTARGGGVMAPIVNSLAHALGSTPGSNPQRAGQYLVLVGAHANLIVAAMFLTGMAANPLVSKAAADLLDVEFGWGRWLLGSVAPGLVSLAVLPLLLFRLAPPAGASGAARDQARQDLAEMGAWTAKQVVLAVVLLLMIFGWTTGALQIEWLGYKLPTTLVALMGVVLLVVLGVERWKDIVGNAAAWDTLIWLGGLITMANALRDTGFTEWLATGAGGFLAGWPGLATVLVLSVAYFYSMYSFSMLTGHILAFAGVFFAVGLAAGAPTLLMVALFAYFSNLCGCLTHYSTGPVVIYFGLGYVPIGRWFAIGFAVSLVHLAIWLGVGLPYWKLLGWW